MILAPIDRAYLDLANAIVTQAANDYRDALNRNHPRRLLEIEKFFRSKWYRILTKVDGEYLIEKLKKEHIENRKEELCESN